VINLQTEPKTKSNNPLLEVISLKKYFPVEGGIIQRILPTQKDYVHAVDDINFTIEQGEIFCLVGESGCGKTTAANILVGLEDATSGSFKWKGESISYNELKPKIKDIKSQIVFQNPYSALSPRMRLGDSVLHSLIIHKRVKDKNTLRRLRNSNLSEIFLFASSLISVFLFILSFMLDAFSGILSVLSGVLLFLTAVGVYLNFSWIQKRKIIDPRVLELFNEVGLTPAMQYYFKYPHEVSGGERQRANIARAIILNPELLIADEPTSMLDVSLRAGILDSLKSLQEKHNISILFITHDLATARHFGDRISVMYVGRVAEMGDVDAIFKNPLHPYTNALIDAIPTPVPGDKSYDLPKGEVPDSIHPPPGCRYHPRCPYAQFPTCETEEPELRELSLNHFVACHFPLTSK
jgi:peptide/nickel transport system ATP-binding protein